MARTKRYKKSKSTRKRTLRTNANSRKKHQNSYARNKKRNSIIRSIRMGRSTFNRLGGGSHVRKDGGGYKCQKGGGGYISQFIGRPWTVSNNPNTSNYFAPSPLGVGTELVPKFEGGQSINNGARWPTQLGTQFPKLGEMKGGSGEEIEKIDIDTSDSNGGNRGSPMELIDRIDSEPIRGGNREMPIDEMIGGNNKKTIRNLMKGGEEEIVQVARDAAKDDSDEPMFITAMGGNKKKTILKRGGGVFDDIKGVYNNIVSSATDFSSKLEGVKPPPSSYAWDQPISRSSERI